MHNDYYIDLIRKDIMNDISDKERSELQAWRSQDQQQELLAQDIYKAWDLSESYNPDVQVDLKADFQAIQEKIKRSEAISPATASSEVAKVIHLKYLIGIAASLLVLAAAWVIMGNQATGQTTYLAQADQDRLELPDGSIAILAKGASVSYNEDFTDGRAIDFEGHGYFIITKDADQPFTIESPHLFTKVLGTKFFINDKSDEASPSIRLTEGRVSVKKKEQNNEIILAPDESAVLVNSSLTKSTFSSSDNDVSWYYTPLNYSDASLREVINDISERYAVNIDLSEALSACTFSGTLAHQNIKEILNAITVMHQATLSEDGDVYRIEGGVCR